MVRACDLNEKTSMVALRLRSRARGAAPQVRAAAARRRHHHRRRLYEDGRQRSAAAHTLWRTRARAPPPPPRARSRRRAATPAAPRPAACRRAHHSSKGSGSAAAGSSAAPPALRGVGREARRPSVHGSTTNCTGPARTSPALAVMPKAWFRCSQAATITPNAQATAVWEDAPGRVDAPAHFNSSRPFRREPQEWPSADPYELAAPEMDVVLRRWCTKGCQLCLSSRLRGRGELRSWCELHLRSSCCTSMPSWKPMTTLLGWPR